MTPSRAKEPNVTTLLLEEIQSAVAEAKDAGSVLRVGPLAQRLFETYPGAGYSLERLIEEIALAATREKVPVEVSRPGAA